MLVDNCQFLCNVRCGGSSPTSLSMSVLSTLLSTFSCNWLSVFPWKWQNLVGRALAGVQSVGIFKSDAGSCLSTRPEFCLGLWVAPFPIHTSVKLSSFWTIVVSNIQIPSHGSAGWCLGGSLCTDCCAPCHSPPQLEGHPSSPFCDHLFNPRRMDTSMKAERRKERKCPFPWLRWSGSDAIVSRTHLPSKMDECMGKLRKGEEGSFPVQKFLPKLYMTVKMSVKTCKHQCVPKNCNMFSQNKGRGWGVKAVQSFYGNPSILPVTSFPYQVDQTYFCISFHSL